MPPNSKLAKAIITEFGSLEGLIEYFNAKTLSVQGSGWAWLVYNTLSNSLEVHTTPNQDRLSDQKLVPILTIDVWEHAYYLDHLNSRVNFMKNIW